MQKVSYILIGIILITFVLYVFSGSKTNPPDEKEVVWNAQATREQFYLACADCHSNETDWPWYANFAPVSWIVIGDVEEGREHFNISSKELGDAEEATEMVESEAMPLKIYLSMHPEAKMSASTREKFADGLAKTFGAEAAKQQEESGHEHSHE